MKIIIGFSNSKGLGGVVSWLINLISGSKASHTFIAFEDVETGELLVFHSKGLYTHLIPYKKFVETSNVYKVFSYEINFAQYIELKTMCFARIMSGYPFLQLLGYWPMLLFNLKKNPLASGDKTTTCSELVAIILFEVLDRACIDASKYEIYTPKDLLLMCEEYKDVQNDIS